MNKIIFHWTAGTWKPNNTDLTHYHYLIDGDGRVYNGKYKPEDNNNCSDGKYAAHTGGGNTNAIGIAFCGMCGFHSREHIGDYPLKLKQCEVGWELAAKLCKKYNIPIANIQTHYGFGKRNPKTSSYGKIDIIYLVPYPEIKQDEIERFIRNKVTWYSTKI